MLMFMNCGLYVFDSLQHTKEQKVQLGFDGRCNARPRLPGCAAPLYVSKQQSLRYPGKSAIV